MRDVIYLGGDDDGSDGVLGQQAFGRMGRRAGIVYVASTNA